MRRLAVLVLLIVAGVVASCHVAPAQPPEEKERASSLSQAKALRFSGFVVDRADILAPEAEARLTRKLDDFQRHTLHQLVVVTVSSLEVENIAAFATALGRRWGVGRRGYDDGVLLLVAPNERKVRIAVGYGLEKNLTDEACKLILDGAVLPEFKRGDYAKGIDAGAAAIITRLSDREP